MWLIEQTFLFVALTLLDYFKIKDILALIAVRVSSCTLIVSVRKHLHLCKNTCIISYDVAKWRNSSKRASKP